jgi:hypothetical protein
LWQLNLPFLFLTRWKSILEKDRKRGYMGNDFDYQFLEQVRVELKLAFNAQKRLMSIIPDVEIHIFQEKQRNFTGL